MIIPKTNDLVHEAQDVKFIVFLINLLTAFEALRLLVL